MHFGSQDIISTDIARFPALIRAFGNFSPKVPSFDPFLAKFTFADFPNFFRKVSPFFGIHYILPYWWLCGFFWAIIIRKRF